MQRRIAALTLLAVATLLAAPAGAVEPAYRGPNGNLEEPALRPYVWLLRGTTALVYHTATSFAEGNLEYPIVGSVYTFRGLRRGLVEWESSLWRGMTHSNPKNLHYTELSNANIYIEQDLLLRNVADALVAVWAWGVINGSIPLRPELAWAATDVPYVNGAAWKAGAVVFLGQKKLDQKDPLYRWTPPASEEASPLDIPVKEAQRRYIGDRADINNRKAEGRGNYLKAVRRAR